MKLTKLIITIPEDKYKYIQGLEQGNTDYATTRMLYHAVKNGTPIPDNATVCDIDCAIKSEGYMRGVNDDRNLWEHRIKQIRADIEAARYGLINDGLDVALSIIDKYTKGE